MIFSQLCLAVAEEYACEETSTIVDVAATGHHSHEHAGFITTHPLKYMGAGTTVDRHACPTNLAPPTNVRHTRNMAG